MLKLDPNLSLESQGHNDNNNDTPQDNATATTKKCNETPMKQHPNFLHVFK